METRRNLSCSHYVPYTQANCNAPIAPQSPRNRLVIAQCRPPKAYDQPISPATMITSKTIGHRYRTSASHV